MPRKQNDLKLKLKAVISYENSPNPVQCETCDEEYSYGMYRVRTSPNGKQARSLIVYCPICQNSVKEV